MMIVRVPRNVPLLCVNINGLPPSDCENPSVTLHISTIDCGSQGGCITDPVARRKAMECWNRNNVKESQVESFTIEYTLSKFCKGKYCFGLDNLFLDKTSGRYSGMILVDKSCVGEFEIQLEDAKITGKQNKEYGCDGCDSSC